MSVPPRLFAFEGHALLAEGPAAEVAAAVKLRADAAPEAAILVFDAETARPVDLDLRGSVAEVVLRHAPTAEPPRDRGRPKLGVVAREVTLLPRHWDWLKARPGGASVELRKLVEAAMKADPGPERARQARETTYRFMSALAGDLPGFEEASRALFAGDRAGFEAKIAAWPADVADRLRRLSEGA